MIPMYVWDPAAPIPAPPWLSPYQVEAGGERLQLRNLGAVTQRNAHLLVINVFNTEVWRVWKCGAKILLPPAAA